jgi:hypothetical protein
VCRNVSQFRRAFADEDVKFGCLKLLTLKELQSFDGEFPTCAPALRTIRFVYCACGGNPREDLAQMPFWRSLAAACPLVTTIVIRNVIPVSCVPMRDKWTDLQHFGRLNVFIRLVRAFSYFTELREISVVSYGRENITDAFTEFSEELLESLRACRKLRRLRLRGGSWSYPIHDRFVSELPGVSFTHEKTIMDSAKATSREDRSTMAACYRPARQ